MTFDKGYFCLIHLFTKDVDLGLVWDLSSSTFACSLFHSLLGAKDSSPSPSPAVERCSCLGYWKRQRIPRIAWFQLHCIIWFLASSSFLYGSWGFPLASRELSYVIKYLLVIFIQYTRWFVTGSFFRGVSLLYHQKQMCPILLKVLMMKVLVMKCIVQLLLHLFIHLANINWIPPLCLSSVPWR